MGIRSDSGIWQYLASEIIGSTETVASALNRLADTTHTQVLALKNRAAALEDRATALEERLPNYRTYTVTRGSVPNSATQVRQLTMTEVRAAPAAFSATLSAVNDPGTSTSVPRARVTLPSGLYSVSFDGSFGVDTNGRSFLELLPSFGQNPRGPIGQPEDRTTVSKTFVATGSWTLEPRLLGQVVTGSFSFAGELTIVRLGALQ